MKAKPFSVDFSKGINLTSSKFIEDGECQIAQDCDFDTIGSVLSRKFKTTHLSFNAKPKAIFPYSNLVTHLESGGLYDFAKLIGSGYGSTPFSGGEYNDVLYLVNGANEIRYNRTTVQDIGNELPTVAPTLSDNGAGSLDGTYYYKYAYVDLNSKVSYYSDVSSSISVSSKQIGVEVTASGDSKISSINIYRLGGTLTDWYYVANVADATAEYTDNNADSSLSTLANADYNYPPQGFNFLIFHFERGIGGKTTTYPNGIWWSYQYEPEYWGNTSTAYNYLMGDNNPCTGLLSWQSMVLFFKKHNIQIGEGATPINWFKRTADTQVGNVAPYALAIYKMPIFCGYDGLYMFDGYAEQEITQKVRQFFKDNSTELANGVGAVYNSKYYFGLKNKTLIVDFLYKRFYTHDYGLSAVLNDKLNNVLYGGVGNNVVKLEQDTNDSDENVNFQLKSKEVALSEIFGQSGSLNNYCLSLNTQGDDVTFNVYVNKILRQAVTLNTSYMKKVDGGLNVADGEFAEFEFTYTGDKQIQIDMPLQINQNDDAGL